MIQRVISGGNGTCVDFEDVLILIQKASSALTVWWEIYSSLTATTCSSLVHVQTSEVKKKKKKLEFYNVFKCSLHIHQVHQAGVNVCNSNADVMSTVTGV